MSTVIPINAPVFDITDAYDGYTGPRIHLTWSYGVGVAYIDDPRVPDPWLLVPASLLRRLADGSGDEEAGREAAVLLQQAKRAL